MKFLSRGKWDADAVAQRLIKLLQQRFDNWVYVYDETRAIKTGEQQFGLHFFRNHRYQKRNTNQSKFHFGHQFGALGLLCTTVTETILFPVWVKLICPKTHRDNSGSVLKRICSQIPSGLIIFDRGFNRRKVFEAVLNAGHHILCRAKSNAVFYLLPTVCKRPKPGRPKTYGKRIQLRHLRYKTIDIDNKRCSVASKVVRTKMCPTQVRLVVMRTRSKKSKPFRYFCVYTTDLTLDLCQIVRYYQKRWLIETAFRDAKQHSIGTVCYHKLGMHQRGAEVLKKGGEKSVKLLEYIIRMGDNQYLDENYEAAIGTYNSAIGINRSKDPELYWKLGVVHQKMGDYEKEAEFCERAIAIKTDYTDALQSLAYVLFYHLNDRDRAVVLEDLANGNGSTYESEKELGEICYKYENYTKAKTQYETAARIVQRHRTDATLPAAQRRFDNQIVYAKVHAAMATYKGRMADKAQEIIDTLTAEYPDHPLVPYGKGQLDFLKGDVDASVASFKASIEKDSSFYAAPIALGEYYLSQENSDAAMAVWEGVIKTHPENRRVRHHLNKLKRELKAQKTAEQTEGATVFTTLKPAKKGQSFLPPKRRTIYPKQRIPKSQLPSALFVGLNGDQVIEKYGKPIEILEPPPNLPNATKRFAYGALVPGISSTFSVEGSEFIFGENGVLGYRKVYFGDVNAFVGGVSEYPALLDEIPSVLVSTLCDVINEQVFAAKKYYLIVQKAQVVWELNDERWWATVHATFPARDFTSDKSIKNYKPNN